MEVKNRNSNESSDGQSTRESLSPPSEIQTAEDQVVTACGIDDSLYAFTVLNGSDKTLSGTDLDFRTDSGHNQFCNGGVQLTQDDELDLCECAPPGVDITNVKSGRDLLSEKLCSVLKTAVPQVDNSYELSSDDKESCACIDSCSPPCSTSGGEILANGEDTQYMNCPVSSASTKENKSLVLNSLELDSFDCKDSEMPVEPQEVSNSNLGKRNRQISTDSSCSVVIESKESTKSTKKPKKKERKKQATDEEVERILAELNQESVPNDNQGGQLNDVVSQVDNTEKASKSKRKSKRKAKSVATETQRGCGESGATVILPSQCDLSHVTSTVETESNNSHKEPGGPLEKSMDELKSSVSSSGVDKPSSQVAETEVLDSKKQRKRPGKVQLAAIRAALQKAREDEERRTREELAKQKAMEEMEKARLEKLRLEQERKERKKQKEKIRKEKMKAEGRFLTKSQKVARARTEAALSAWRAHGIELPNVGKKDPDHDFKDRQRVNSRTESYSEDVSSYERTNVVSRSKKSVSVCETGADNFRGNDCLNHRPPSAESSVAVTQSVKVRTRTKSESDLLAKENIRPSFRSKVNPSFTVGDEAIGDFVLRSPIICVLGHVDTGKTKILDKIRKTHIQENEAGGITQQIGATMVPIDALREKCRMVKDFHGSFFQLPGLLIIDTPGHESFRNLRSRGSLLCDIAVLVVDIMHGLEQQTFESIDLLKSRKTPFVIALNKIDRLYGWKSDAELDVEELLRLQDVGTFTEFDKRCKHVIAELAKLNLNAALFYENNDPRTFVSIVPVSAITGDGMGNLLSVTCLLCQKMLFKQLKFSEELEASVLEVKATAGLGTTIDVILVNGRLNETDTIVLAGQDGPIVTQIRSLLMPQPLRELRVKNPYKEFKTLKGAQGVKISGKDLDKAIAGLPLFVSKGPDDLRFLKEKVTKLYRNTINSIKLSERGVYVQASTLGSLEALLNFLNTSNIPYSGVKVGPVVKKDVIKASVMLEHDIQYAVILAFDVKVERDALELADHLGIKLFQADIIYHLFDSYVSYRDELHNKRMNEVKKLAVFPCKLTILPQYVFSVRNPISIGVHVNAGILKIGTPLCVPSRNVLDIGTVTAIEAQNQSLDCAKEGDDVCIKIEPVSEETPKVYGKHFDDTDTLVSKISRQTIDTCKEFYRDVLQKSDWQLMVELKKLLMIT